MQQIDVLFFWTGSKKLMHLVKYVLSALENSRRRGTGVGLCSYLEHQQI
jgi:hypothetical protein